jgi:hypothetical protein
MTLEGLSEGWNNLRNAVLGRGTDPPKGVPAVLVSRVANAYDRWRAWYVNEGLAASLVSDVRQLGWLAEYRELVAEAKAAGIEVQELQMGTVEATERKLSRTAQNLRQGLGEGMSKLGMTVALMGVMLSVPALAFAILGARKR